MCEYFTRHFVPRKHFIVKPQCAYDLITMLIAHQHSRTSFTKKEKHGFPSILTYSSFMTKLSISAFHTILESSSTPENKKKASRRPALFDQRLQWDTFCAKYAGRQDFERHLRMSDHLFAKLLGYVRDAPSGWFQDGSFERRCNRTRNKSLCLLALPRRWLILWYQIFYRQLKRL